MVDSQETEKEPSIEEILDSIRQIISDDDVDETIIWRYDLSKNKTGPYEVEIKSKNPRATPKPVTSRKLTKKIV